MLSVNASIPPSYTPQARRAKRVRVLECGSPTLQKRASVLKRRLQQAYTLVQQQRPSLGSFHTTPPRATMPALALSTPLPPQGVFTRRSVSFVEQPLVHTPPVFSVPGAGCVPKPILRSRLAMVPGDKQLPGDMFAPPANAAHTLPSAVPGTKRQLKRVKTESPTTFQLVCDITPVSLTPEDSLHERLLLPLFAEITGKFSSQLASEENRAEAKLPALSLLPGLHSTPVRPAPSVFNATPGSMGAAQLLLLLALPRD